MKTREKILQNYNEIIQDIRLMIDERKRGSKVAKLMNEEMWDNLEIHKQRLGEQYGELTEIQDEAIFKKIESRSDSIYEAAKEYLNVIK